MKPGTAPFVVTVATGAAALAPLAAAQPGTRNAIQYAARAVGETDWHIGNFSLQSSDSNPLTFEIGMFAYRAQGIAFSTALYKTYIDGVANDNITDACTVIDDLGNGISPDDGRQDTFNSGAQTQRVFTNRGPGVTGSGYRNSSFSDTADAGAPGGISVKQVKPVNPDDPHFGDGLLTYRFNLTVSCPSPGSLRNFVVDTPTSRINSFTTYNFYDSDGTTEYKTSVVVDGLALRASWVPAPSPLALAGLGALLVARRRR